jgi:AGZA family xanthine/uracil permease-like MFS transporter
LQHGGFSDSVMMQGLARIDLADLSNAISITLTLLITVLTNNLINGMALGTLSLILILVATGRAKQITGVVWGLGAVFALFFYVTTMLMQRVTGLRCTLFSLRCD